MLYCTFNSNGSTEIRNDSSTELPVGGYALSASDYASLLAGSSVASLTTQIVTSEETSVVYVTDQISALTTIQLAAMTSDQVAALATSQTGVLTTTSQVSVLTTSQVTALSVTPYVAPALTLDEAKASQTLIISQACQQAILSGFQSSALGSAYYYPSGLVDQQNLAANVLSSLMPLNPSGWTTLQLCGTVATPSTWGYNPHTAVQIQQVGIDAKAAIMANLVRNATKAYQVNSIQPSADPVADNAAVAAITWIS